MVFYALLVIFLIVFGYYYKSEKLNYWKKRNVVQINKNTWHFIFGKYSLCEFYKNIYDLFEAENFVGTFVGLKPVLIIKNPEDIKTVLQSDFQTFHSRGFKTNPKDDLAQNLLLIDNYTKWRLIRQKISPTFTSKKLKNMYNILERSSSDFVKYIKMNPYMKENPYEALHKFTSASISASVFGINPNTKNLIESPLVDIIWNVTDSFASFNFKLALANIFPKLHNFLNLKVFGAQKDVVVDAIKNILKYRRNMKEKCHDFIDACMEMENEGVINDNVTQYKLKVTPEFLGAQAYSLFFAGVDTVANSMHFTLLELSNNSEILKKVHDEIDYLFDNCEGSISFKDIMNLKYLDMVICESLRKYPPIGLMQRICANETSLSSNVKVDKGVIVVVPIYGIHRDARYFPNPDKFDPERFSPQNRMNMVKYCYMPFGEGNRMCIGARFAMIQMKSGLAWLLKHYTLKGYNYMPNCFEPSLFVIRDSKARYDLIARNEIVIS